MLTEMKWQLFNSTNTSKLFSETTTILTFLPELNHNPSASSKDVWTKVETTVLATLFMPKQKLKYKVIFYGKQGAYPI